MRRICNILLFLAVWPSIPAHATMGIGISELCRDNVSNSCTTAGVTSTNGSTFIVCIAGDGTVATPTDSKSNTYTPIAGQVSLAANNSRCYQALNATGGTSHTFTGTVTAATVITVAAVEVTTTGTITAGPAVTGTDAATPFTSPGLTTTVADSMLVGMQTTEGPSGTCTPTHGNSFTGLDSETDGNSYFPMFSSNRLVAATGTYNTSITVSCAQDNTANWVMSYHEGGGGGSAASRFMLLGVGP